MFASTLITCEAALDQPVKEVQEPSPGNSIVKQPPLLHLYQEFDFRS